MTYNSENRNKFTVHKPGYDMDFIKIDNGLYYHDMSDMSMSFHIMTVEGNQQMLTRQEHEQVVNAHKLYVMVERLSM
eukprot:8014155-Ditylum_brightwellii.AAC.1